MSSDRVAHSVRVMLVRWAGNVTREAPIGRVCAGRPEPHEFKPLDHESRRKRPDARIVECRPGETSSGYAGAAAVVGSEMMNRVPAWVLSTRTDPPESATNPFTMASPSPLPLTRLLRSPAR